MIGGNRSQKTETDLCPLVDFPAQHHRHHRRASYLHRSLSRHLVLHRHRLQRHHQPPLDLHPPILPHYHKNNPGQPCREHEVSEGLRLWNV
jgi:hypothetical protein